MKSYPSYKYSGVEWVGEIPRGWKFARLGFGVDTIVPMRDKPTNLSGDIPWIRIEDYDGKYISRSKSNQGVSEEIIEDMNLKVYPTGTVLCTCSCSFGTTMIVKRPILSNQTFIGLVPKNNEFSSEYLYYLLQTWGKELEFLSSGSIQQYLSRDNFKSLKVVVPPLQEQKQISNYLDQKTKQIDELIEKTKQKVELLKEKRTSLINHCVTKGLEPNVGMKDSGVGWIGEIPSGWVTSKIKYILEKNKDSIRTGPFGSQLKSTDMVEEGIRIYNQRTVYDEDFTSGDIFVTPEKYENMKGFTVLNGDILISSRGTIGKMTIVPEGSDIGVLHPCLIRLRVDKNIISKSYLWWYMNHSSLFLESVKIKSNSTTIDVIYSNVLTEIQFPLPLLTEQQQIVTHLDKETRKIDTLIEKENKRIKLLKEYRQSLISEVVTGKIDVREEVLQ